MERAEVLLVEDSPEDIELTLRALHKNVPASRVHVARDGQEALDYLFGDAAAAPPRVILLDLKMPRIGGFEILGRLKLSPELKAVPVVILTSSREEADVKRAYQMGANSYIVKPVDFDKFAAVLSQVGFYWTVLNEPPQ